ncbi:triacylglycerol lipase [Starmerella bacillaris]|uniref:Triacylglycerol lipase n=1 Tax=Starmerella bacillaris TaxID=1247836 RepID=A0AAV5RPK7_STABA|nr:triacylglycerol lipase [Starmerella bacillaris]
MVTANTTSASESGNPDERDISEYTLKELSAAQQNATDYETWRKFSRAIDHATGQDEWKLKKESPVYDYEEIQKKLDDLRDARLANNVDKLIYLVRTTFSRNIGNMGDTRLYTHCQCGTKQLIEDYISECELALQHIVKNTTDPEKVLETLVETKKAFGNTALVLSGGSIMGFLHAGVARELLDNGLLPRIISGTSAGSIFASLICIHRDEDFDKLWEIAKIPLSIFEPIGQAESFATRLKRFLTVGTWIDSKFLRLMMQELLGDITFQEAYNRTGRILNVSVSVKGSHDMPRLLNYLTAPNVLIWSAVVCSCSVPYVFAADSVLAIDPVSRKLFPWTQASFMDGSVDNDMPLGRLTEMFNVNHFVACQVNPHIAPLIPRPSISPEQKLPKRGWLNSKINAACRSASSFFMDELEYTLSILKVAGIGGSPVNLMLKIILQDYYGDVTMVPPIYLKDWQGLLNNPTQEQVDEMIERGARTTWPQLAIIRNHCAVELALDRAVVELRAQCIRTIARLASPVPPTLPTYEYEYEDHDTITDDDETSDSSFSAETKPRRPARRFLRSNSVSAPWTIEKEDFDLPKHTSPRAIKLHEA